MLLHVVGGVALDASRRAAQCNAILALMPIASQKLPSMELYAAILPSDVRESGEIAHVLMDHRQALDGKASAEAKGAY